MKKNKKINLKKSDIIKPVISVLASALLFLNAPAYVVAWGLGAAAISIFKLTFKIGKFSGMCDEFNTYDEKLAYLIIILSGLLDFNKGNFDINNLSNIISSVSYFLGLITASSLLNLYIKTFPSNEENEPVIEEIEKEKQVIEEKENTKETKEKSKELSIQEQIELCNEYKKQLLNTGNELEEEKTYTKKY